MLCSELLLPTAFCDSVEIRASLLFKLGGGGPRGCASSESENIIETCEFEPASVKLEEIGHRFEITIALTQESLGLLLS